MAKKPEPLLLTCPVDEEVPAAADWNRANALFDHPRSCRCSTCRLSAELGYWIRRSALQSASTA